MGTTALVVINLVALAVDSGDNNIYTHLKALGSWPAL